MLLPNAKLTWKPSRGNCHLRGDKNLVWQICISKTFSRHQNLSSSKGGLFTEFHTEKDKYVPSVLKIMLRIQIHKKAFGYKVFCFLVSCNNFTLKSYLLQSLLQWAWATHNVPAFPSLVFIYQPSKRSSFLIPVIVPQIVCTCSTFFWIKRFTKRN